MYTNILVPIDLDDKHSWQITLKKAVEIKAAYPKARLHIMTVIQTFVSLIEDFFPREWIDEVQAKALVELKKIVKQHIPKEIETACYADQGIIYQAILNKISAIKADLIIIGAHHPDRYDYLLGPNAASVVRHADISVLVVRGNR